MIEKYVNKLLDKYFSRKIIYLAEQHFRFNYSVSSDYDNIYQEYFVYVSKDNITLTAIRFKKHQSIIFLINLLNKGWTVYDNYLRDRFLEIEEENQ